MFNKHRGTRMKSRWFVKSILVAMLISFSGFAKGVKVVSKTTDAKGNPKETSTIKFANKSNRKLSTI